MLQLEQIKKLALAILVLTAGVNAFALQALPVPGKPAAVDFTMEAGCNECDLASNSRLPAAVETLAEFNENEQFKNQTIGNAVIKPRSRGSEFAPIGMIVDPETKLWSGATLVGECYIWADRHIVSTTAEFERKNGSAPYYFKFLVGPGNGKRPFEKMAGARAVAWGRYEKSAKNIHEDWTLLQLDDCLGTKDQYGYIEIDTRNLNNIPSVEFVKAGFPDNTDPGVGTTVDETCEKSASVNDYILVHTCLTRPGDSGGPIMSRMKGARLSMVGTISHSADDGSGGVAVSAYGIKHVLKRYLPYLNETQLAHK